MKLFSLTQLVMAIIFLICIVTISVAHTILGNISFFGGIIALVFILLAVNMLKISYKEYKAEKKSITQKQ